VRGGKTVSDGLTERFEKMYFLATCPA